MRSLPFVLLGLVSLWILYLGVRPAPPRPVPATQHVHTEPAASSATTSAAERAPAVRFDNNAPGYAVYRSRGCQTCHGADALGSRMGPSLAEVRLHYDRETLAAYLHDPSATLDTDERLQRLQSGFPRVSMPASPDLTGTELDDLLGFLLEPALP